MGAPACLAALGVLPLRRPRGATAPAAPPPLAPDDAPWPLPARRALAAGAAAGAIFGFAFALRAGVAIGPVVALLLWRGVSARTLIVMAGGVVGVCGGAL